MKWSKDIHNKAERIPLKLIDIEIKVIDFENETKIRSFKFLKGIVA
jgi:hypothetical protein